MSHVSVLCGWAKPGVGGDGRGREPFGPQAETRFHASGGQIRKISGTTFVYPEIVPFRPKPKEQPPTTACGTISGRNFVYQRSSQKPF